MYYGLVKLTIDKLYVTENNVNNCLTFILKFVKFVK